MAVPTVTALDRLLIDNMKKGLGIESGEKKYKALNTYKGPNGDKKPTYAFGLYQFVPYSHLEDMRKYAEKYPELGMDIKDMPTYAQFKKLQNAKDDKAVDELFQVLYNNKEFQDAFYDQWMTKDIIPNSKKLHAEFGEKYNLPLEAFIASSHIMGSTGARTKWLEAEKNPAVLDEIIDPQNPISTNDYIKKFTKGITDKGGQLTYTTPEEDAILDPNYTNIENIKSSVLDNAVTPEQKGWKKHFTEYDELKKTYIQKQNDLQKAEEDGLDASIIQAEKDVKDAEYNLYKKGYTLQNVIDEKRLKQAEEDVKLYRKGHQKEKDAQQVIKELKGNVLGKPKQVANKAEWLEGRQPNSGWKLNSGLSPKAVKEDRDKRELYLEQHRNILVGDPINPTDPSIIQKIDQEKDKREKAKVVIQNKVKKAKDNIKSITDDKKDVTEDLPPEEEVLPDAPIDPLEIAKINKEAGDYLSRFDEPIENIRPDVFDYDAGNWKQEIPFEAIGAGALGLMGMADAKTPLPERDDKISNAILQYSNDLKMMAQMGLKPEEEAKMKQEIAEAYQQGITNIVKASGGNRNLVLGALGGLNKGVIDGISNIGLLDMTKKADAFDKYGKTLEYIDNFNRTKSIDNYKVKLEDAQSKRLSGAQLASSAFAKMADDIQYAKENGPGSINHRYKQAMLYEITGVNAGIKDDGSGTIPGTASYVRAQRAIADQAYYDRKIKYDTEVNAQNSFLALPEKDKIYWKNNGGYVNFRQQYQSPKEQDSNGSLTPTPMEEVINRTSQYSPDDDFNSYSKI